MSVRLPGNCIQHCVQCKDGMALVNSGFLKRISGDSWVFSWDFWVFPGLSNWDGSFVFNAFLGPSAQFRRWASSRRSGLPWSDANFADLPIPGLIVGMGEEGNLGWDWVSVLFSSGDCSFWVVKAQVSH